MEFRIVHEQDEIIVVTESGGVACIRQAENINGETRTATTDYYTTRLTEVADADSDNLFDVLAEGQMFADDWESVAYNSLEAITAALNWLSSPTAPSWELVDDLFPQFFPVK
ncbi:hypothetical protein [Vibrio crassostreae]|uniref:hypothetical protein n=1 Tax=Vibrio crassostreae TaxID=246167 RepID=UPI001B314C4F|nr:hypothetical protein [Vibrio crassostreae]